MLPPTETKNIPLISIILVCFNSETTIEQTILSIINLEYNEKEFIIIDGNSTDNTKKIIDKYLDKIDIYLSEQDEGIYDAMNKGIKTANGDYFYFIGSDDIIVNSWSNLNNRLISQNEIYYGNVYFPNTNILFDGRFNFIKLLTKNICHQSIFYPRNVFEKYTYCTKYKISADFHLNLLLNSDDNFKFKYINILIAIYSQNGISSKKIDTLFQNDHLKIIKSNYSYIIFFYIFSRKLLSKFKR